MAEEEGISRRDYKGKENCFKKGEEGTRGSCDDEKKRLPLSLSYQNPKGAITKKSRKRDKKKDLEKRL